MSQFCRKPVVIEAEPRLPQRSQHEDHPVSGR